MRIHGLFLGYSEPEEYSEACQTSTMKCFEKQLTPIIIFESYLYFRNISFSCPLVHETNMIFYYMSNFDSSRLWMWKSMGREGGWGVGRVQGWRARDREFLYTFYSDSNVTAMSQFTQNRINSFFCRNDTVRCRRVFKPQRVSKYIERLPTKFSYLFLYWCWNY